MTTEFNKEEWFVIVKAAKPDITEAEYDVMWDGFVQMKTERNKD